LLNIWSIALSVATFNVQTSLCHGTDDEQIYLILAKYAIIIAIVMYIAQAVGRAVNGRSTCLIPETHVIKVFQL